MRKQTKLVAVLSAAALLAMGASMTSFADWQRDDAGIWHYYDSDDEMITGEWRRDGGKWFYLDDEGDMLTNSWVDDEYYVGEDGAMLINQWIKSTPDEDSYDPDDDGEYWYFFGSRGKKVTDDNRKINGKTYYFNEDGEMLTGWHQEDNGNVYYLGSEDEGWRAENQWLWLEKSGLNEDDDDDNVEVVLNCDEDDDCDDEGWYWFGSSGKMENDTSRKRINGRYYMFNNHGQMLYEWINGTAHTVSSNAQLDGIASPGQTNVADMRYYNAVEEGWRADGWYQMEGAEDVGTEDDTDWYYVDDGEIEHAEASLKDYATDDDDGAVYVARIRVEGRYFAFNEKGQMQTGLQYINDDNGFFYFDENGYQRTGRVTSVECDDDDYTFYFNTSNGRNGQGYSGINSNTLYFNGKRLDADDDYRLYFYDGNVYLVNRSGRVQRSDKSYDIENRGYGDDIEVTFNGNRVETINNVSVATVLADVVNNSILVNNAAEDIVTEDMAISIPFIQLYDDDLYTYTFTRNAASYSEGWLGLN